MSAVLKITKLKITLYFTAECYLRMAKDLEDNKVVARAGNGPANED